MIRRCNRIRTIATVAGPLLTATADDCSDPPLLDRTLKELP